MFFKKKDKEKIKDLELKIELLEDLIEDLAEELKIIISKKYYNHKTISYKIENFNKN